MKGLLLALLLLPASATAAPVTFDPPATFHVTAAGCSWGQTFNADGRVAPPCRGAYTVQIFLPPGEPTTLWGTLAYYPTGFDSHAAVTVSQAQRVTMGGGVERFTLPAELADGDYFFAVALGTEAQIYSFTLKQIPEPTGGGLLGTSGGSSPHETPDPGTLWMVGSSLVGLGWWIRKRRGR